MPLLLLTLALSLPASAANAEHPAEVAGDAVLADLAAGRAQAAVRRLQRKIAETQDPAQAAALRCVLGPALRRAGDLRGAIAVLAQVPQDADCGPRAAFDRADAHVALGELDLAAALYAEVGGDRLGPGRDAAVADRLGLLIAKLRAAEAPDGDQPPDARARELALYRLALGLTLPPERRLNLALEAGLRELDSRARPGHPGGGLGDAVAAVLQERLLAEDLDPAVEVDARLVAARLVGGARGLELLARVPAGVDPGELARARAECALAIDLQAGLDALEVAAALRPADRPLQRQLAERLQAAGQSGRALGPLAVLAAGDDEAAAWALFTLGRLERSLADDPVLGADAAVLRLKELVRRFPASPLRAQAESALLEAALAAPPRGPLRAGDPAVTPSGRYDAYLAGAPRRRPAVPGGLGGGGGHPAGRRQRGRTAALRGPGRPGRGGGG